MSDSEAVAAAARRDPAENEAESAGPGGHGSQGSARIYYDLTEFGWYRRGEPLVHAGSPYEPGARPRVIRPPALRPEGEYQGVEFYVLRNGPTRPDTVYVPVFRNYWQPFVRLTRPPAPAQD